MELYAEQREQNLAFACAARALLSARGMTRVTSSAYTARAVCMGVSQRFVNYSICRPIYLGVV